MSSQFPQKACHVSALSFTPPVSFHPPTASSRACHLVGVVVLALGALIHAVLRLIRRVSHPHAAATPRHGRRVIDGEFSVVSGPQNRNANQG